jgi:hypothetical protein
VLVFVGCMLLGALAATLLEVSPQRSVKPEPPVGQRDGEALQS